MDGASDDQVWWVRRAVIALLLVVGIATTVFAVVATRSGEPEEEQAEDGAPVEVVTDFAPSDEVSEGPLRLGEVLVVGRHGDPVAKPEHTAESYADALDAGVDYLETQVVMTQDEQLVVRSDHELSGSTDVAERDEYADRETTKDVDGVMTTGWFTEDFTLDELRTLNATEPDPELRADSASFDGDFALISFDDLLVQLGEFNTEQDTEVGLFVQPVRASYFRGNGLPMERAIAKSLRRARLVNEPERVTIESSDRRLLSRLEGNLGDNVLSAYVIEADAVDELEEDALAELPDTIDAIVVEVGAFSAFTDDPAELPARIHDAGFAMVVYPISYENALLAPGFQSGEGVDPSARGNLKGQVDGLRMIGVDTILAESPGDVVDVVDELAEEKPRTTSASDASD